MNNNNEIENNKLPNPLKGKRICLTGEFRIPQKKLYSRLKAVGVEIIDRVSDTRSYKEGDAIPPVKETTHFFIVGTNPNEDSIKRYELNKHDGYHAKMIGEEQLYEYLNGNYTEEDIVSDQVVKCLNIDINYYNWKAPIINGKEFLSRKSSPLEYDIEGKKNYISGKEIYIPETMGVEKSALKQIIGNLGGYANNEYFNETDMILLSNETLKKLEQGIKDEIIINIENQYNNSNRKIFNVQFTSEYDFLNWVKKRVKLYPDKSTLKLLDSIRLQ